MADRRLKLLNHLEQHVDRPRGRTVVLGARISSSAPFAVTGQELRACDPGARVPGGKVVRYHEEQSTSVIELMTWNTGEASDLRKYGNLTHAEKQLFEFLKDRPVTSIEIELTHSPCTACCDLLSGLLRNATEQAPYVLKRTDAQGRKLFDKVRPTAVIRWIKLYEHPLQSTTWPYLEELQQSGWKLEAPGSALPPGSSGIARVKLL